MEGFEGKIGGENRDLQSRKKDLWCRSSDVWRNLNDLWGYFCHFWAKKRKKLLSFFLVVQRYNIFGRNPNLLWFMFNQHLSALLSQILAWILEYRAFIEYRLQSITTIRIALLLTCQLVNLFTKMYRVQLPSGNIPTSESYLIPRWNISILAFLCVFAWGKYNLCLTAYGPT